MDCQTGLYSTLIHVMYWLPKEARSDKNTHMYTTPQTPKPKPETLMDLQCRSQEGSGILNSTPL